MKCPFLVNVLEANHNGRKPFDPGSDTETITLLGQLKNLKSIFKAMVAVSVVATGHKSVAPNWRSSAS